jgi:hypothetical protein
MGWASVTCRLVTGREGLVGYSKRGQPNSTSDFLISLSGTNIVVATTIIQVQESRKVPLTASQDSQDVRLAAASLSEYFPLRCRKSWT